MSDWTKKLPEQDPSDGALTDDTTEHDTTGTVSAEPTTAEATVEVRRNGRLATVVALLSGLVGLAFLVRGGGVVDWTLAGVLLVLAGAWGWVALDARTPLLVADGHGIRIRLGKVWNGMPWEAIDEVEHLPRRGALRDGRLVLLPLDADGQEAAIPAGARLRARLARMLYGVPFAVPLGLTTEVVGGSRSLTERLAWLAGERTTIVEIDPSLAEGPEPENKPEIQAEDEPESQAEDETGVHVDDQPVADRPVADRPVADRPVADRPAPPAPAPVAGPHDTVVVQRPRFTADQAPTEGPGAPTATAPAPPVVTATPTPSPLREPVRGVRAEINREAPVHGANALVTAPLTEAVTSIVAVPVAGVTPIAQPGEAVEPLVIEDHDLEPAADPVIGPELAAARTRLGLTVDQLAERTRIRPHVIESIEVDDFAPCGGDFYARGHLRTLARVLGVDGAPLLATYDATYADAPVDPRAVFQAELATGSAGTIRRMRGGPNWSVLVAAVMAVVLLWSVARLVMDGTSAPAPQVAGLANGSQGATNPYAKTQAPVPVVLTAAGGGAHVVVRDGRGDVVFSGDLAFGQSKSFKVSPPVRVQSSDGSVEVSVDGGSAGALGATGEQAQKTFTVR